MVHNSLVELRSVSWSLFQIYFEAILAQKIGERSIHGPHMARKYLRLIDKQATGHVSIGQFLLFLEEFTVTSSNDEIESALKKYQRRLVAHWSRVIHWATMEVFCSNYFRSNA